MILISERNIKNDEVIKIPGSSPSVFDQLTSNQDGIGQSLKDGLRIDKIVGTCDKCKSDLIIRRGTRYSFHRLLRLSGMQVSFASSQVWNRSCDRQAV